MLTNEILEGERLKTRLNLPPRQETEHSTVRLVLNARYPVDVSQRPGSMMMYCNYNFDLVAEIVRRVSGLAFEDFVREHVFEPLEMTDSSFRLEERFRAQSTPRDWGRRPVRDPDGRSELWLRTPRTEQ
ncbi:MAG: serine hydrolase [Gammaproteobacteria bacterium]